jgi:hypothetical protein
MEFSASGDGAGYGNNSGTASLDLAYEKNRYYKVRLNPSSRRQHKIRSGELNRRRISGTRR